MTHGLLRYSQELPPGFEDKDNPEKKGIKIYGDLILWFQIIDMAKEKKLPVILVTNETKKDWWWKPPSSKQIGPRPELISEFNRNTKEIFYMYALDKFLMYSNKYLKTSIKKEYIEEVEEHRTEEESKAQEIEDLRQSAFSHYLEQQENMKKLISPAIADYLMQQENMKKLISPAFADYLVQQENMKKLISPALTCYTKQQESIKKSLLPDMSETAKPKKTLRSLKSSRKLDEKAGEKNSKK
jgi:hypothetical protein